MVPNLALSANTLPGKALGCSASAPGQAARVDLQFLPGLLPEKRLNPALAARGWRCRGGRTETFRLGLDMIRFGWTFAQSTQFRVIRAARARPFPSGKAGERNHDPGNQDFLGRGDGQPLER